LLVRKPDAVEEETTWPVWLYCITNNVTR